MLNVAEKRIFSLIGIFILINLFQAFITPISEDEAYYWVWSQNLDWGYFDHPPMIAWWISTGYHLFQNELGVRLLTVLLNGFSLYFLWKILLPKTNREFQLFFLIWGSVLVFNVFGFLATPDAPLLFFTISYLFSLKKFLEQTSVFATFLLGISFAGLMYSKYHGILVIVFTLLPLWKLLGRNPKFYLAVLGSLVLYFPHIFWLIQNEFVPIHYHFLERSSDETFEFRKLFNYLGIYFLGAAPFLSYFIFTSIFRFRSDQPFWKSIWALAVLPGIFFFLSIFKDNVQPQWLLISFLAMALLMYRHYHEKNLKWVFKLGFAGLVLVLILRILIVLPGISPLYKNENFGKEAGSFQVENAIFEKYQEASVYKFFNPEKNVAVHRTLGNRHSQYSLWNWEENFHGQTITYISPWVKAENSFVGYKNRDYYLKEIQNYQTYHLIEIETIEGISAKPNERIQLKINIRNGHKRPIKIGGNSELKLNVNYYQNLQYEILYSTEILTEEFELQPAEEKELQIEFQNISEKEKYKAAIGIQYTKVGTTYLSDEFLINVL